MCLGGRSSSPPPQPKEKAEMEESRKEMKWLNEKMLDKMSLKKTLQEKKRCRS